ncbi:MAG: hypothetical protein EZS28_007399 [Streblomastix strix]|uniref:Uncharacterized protein n=1 Tax=Streblomastix strix TaxID=222440 RepID=A0A5J4WQ38_9EUKA|nr:MAG: hypothetical protein EZS28_007399 [Streblomastix strix]
MDIYLQQKPTKKPISSKLCLQIEAVCSERASSDSAGDDKKAMCWEECNCSLVQYDPQEVCMYKFICQVPNLHNQMSSLFTTKIAKTCYVTMIARLTQ